MPSPLQPRCFPCKRDASSIETCEFSPAKKHCNGILFNTGLSGVENVAPAQQGIDMALLQYHQRTCHAVGQQVVGAAITNSTDSCMMEQDGAPKPIHANECMDMDLNNQDVTSKFTRFPPNGARSPTHWHTGTAIGFQRSWPETGWTMEEMNVRTWECHYGGLSDYY
uniref:Uncharacterized protein n=1 Tax=Guillardia theta TaxID=55529 RepID=A0A7S4KQ66_GUITH|mmetsp:Transcript_28433/g.91881  ORF Transcript_28433/g.91881 Transcript_28433/m.91881 type:complete len:167 (+) Transcript_28433:180-680(+)